MNIDSNTIGWLRQFSKCVREKDIKAGKTMFAVNVHSFGSRIGVVDNLEDLVINQWTPTWLNTEDFHFLEEMTNLIVSNDHSLVCVVALWESMGIDENQQRFLRRGRCTLVLKRDESAPFGYLAVHSNFSKMPLNIL